MQVGASDLRAVLGGEQQEERDGNSGDLLLGISPVVTAQRRDPGVFRPAQKVLFTRGCLETPGVSS